MRLFCNVILALKQVNCSDICGDALRQYAWVKLKVKVFYICLESRSTLTHDFTPVDITFSPGHTWQGGHQCRMRYSPNLESLNQVTNMAGWPEAVWKAKFTRHFCTWPMIGVKPDPYWSESLPPYPLSHVCLLVETDENFPPPKTYSKQQQRHLTNHISNMSYLRRQLDNSYIKITWY